MREAEAAAGAKDQSNPVAEGWGFGHAAMAEVEMVNPD